MLLFFKSFKNNEILSFFKVSFLFKTDILLTKIKGYKQKYYFCVMQILKQLLNFYINSSIHVALAVYSLIRITEFYYQLPYNEPLDYFIFYGTITGYNFVKYAGVAKLHHRSLTTNLKVIQVFSFVCFLFMCYYGVSLPFKTILLFVPLGILTLLYAVPVLSGFQKNLRSIGYLKVVVVAFVWSIVTVVLPLYETKLVFNVNLILILLQRFLLVIVLILPFDIRDMQYDAITLHTIPRKIGVKKTKIIGIFLLFICVSIELILNVNYKFFALFFVMFMFLSVLLMKASEKQVKYYSSFWVESVPFFWWISILYFVK